MRITSTLIVIALFTIFFRVSGMEITVSLYNEKSISSLLFSPINDNYILIADGKPLDTIPQSNSVYLTVFGDFILISQANGHSGIFRSVHFRSTGENAEFRLRPLHQVLEARDYHGNVTFSVEYLRMKIINSVSLELYIAAVVEAEAGNNSRPEFYKAQATICRTYALKHLNRHSDEGFNLCDEVHCQVHKGRLKRNPVILEATVATQGRVIIDKDSVLITGAFHSNCGGQTVNSEDVWLVARPYLRSVTDPYCIKRNKRTWEKIIPFEDWKNYLIKNGYEENLRNQSVTDFRFVQKTRVSSYRLNGNSLPLSKIRNDWRLRSSFFSVESHPNGTEIIIRGQGFGHGIGMCQEGAMQMAAEGKSAAEIINFYFQGVFTTEYTRLKEFRF